MKRKPHKGLKITVRILAVLGILVFVNFIPTFYLKTPGMSELQGKYVTVYYEKEEAAATDVFVLAESESKRIADKLGFASPQDINLYIYDKQSTLQTKKYGLIVLLLNQDFYIGDNRGTNVILTSPTNPGDGHDYMSVRGAAVHEMVHAYNYLLNPNTSLWVKEGLATYLADQKPPEDLYDTSYFIPSIKQTHVINPITFNRIGGYTFAYTYIEYLDRVFGWDNFLTYAETGDFESAFGMDEQGVYDGWIDFLKENYRRAED